MLAAGGLAERKGNGFLKTTGTLFYLSADYKYIFSPVFPIKNGVLKKKNHLNGPISHIFFRKMGLCLFFLYWIILYNEIKSMQPREREGRVYEKTVPYCGNSTKKRHAGLCH